MAWRLPPERRPAGAAAGSGGREQPIAGQRITLQFHVFAIERLGLGRGRRGQRRVVGLARTGDVALGREHVAADFVEQRREGTGLVHVEQLERVVVLALLGEHAGKAGLRDQAQFRIARGLSHGAQALRGLVEVAGIHGEAREREVGLVGIRRLRVQATQVARLLRGRVLVVLAERVEHGDVGRLVLLGRLELRLLPVLPARQAAEAEGDAADDPQPVLGPEASQLFFAFVV